MRSTDNVVSRGLLGLVALAALGIAAPAHAQVIFSNFGPGDSYRTDSGLRVRGDSGPLSESAGFFTTGADGYGNLVFEGAFMQLNGPTGITMRLMGDSGGLPDEGVVLATSSPLIPVASPGSSILTWTLNPTVTLAPNTKYWFAASAIHSDGSAVWFQNNTGQTGAALKWEPPFLTWSSYPITTSAAFRVSGSVLGAGAVPEPSEWAAMGVLGLALGGLVVRKRRKA